MLHKVKPKEVLQAVIEKNIPVTMSYLCGRQWQLARVLLTDLRVDGFDVKVSPRKKSRPINIRVEQSVGMLFKYEFGDERFIFDTTVIALKSSAGPMGDERIVLAMPQQIEVVQKSSFLPVKVPKSLQITVHLTSRDYNNQCGQVPAEHCWQGRLIEISAEKLQIIVNGAQESDFDRKQSIGLRFTPLSYETPLMFSAQIRNVLPRADNDSICLAVQMVGLEASPEGRLILRRLCNVVEQYRQMNQADIEQGDLQPVSTVS